jgi:hypothetical protein
VNIALFFVWIWEDVAHSQADGTEGIILQRRDAMALSKTVKNLQSSAATIKLSRNMHLVADVT